MLIRPPSRQLLRQVAHTARLSPGRFASSAPGESRRIVDLGHDPVEGDVHHVRAVDPMEEVTIQGWVRSCRRMKNVSFAVLNDGSNVKGVQAVIPKGMDAGLAPGAAVVLRGKLVDSPGQGQQKEFQAVSVEVVGESNAESYPIPNTKQGIPDVVLRRNAHLRARTSSTAAMLRLRSEMARGVNEYLRSQDFVNVQTPLITSSDCEGAGEVFRVESGPTPPPPPPPPSSTAPSSTSLPSPQPILPPPSPRYLTVSSQLHLEALAASLTRVYTLSPAFRAEKSDTARHLQEFWMLEAEMGFLPASETDALEQVMAITEGIVKAAATSYTRFCGRELAFFESQTPGIQARISSLVSSDSPPFARLTYTNAIKILESHASLDSTAFAFTPSWGAPLQTEHEKWLAGTHFRAPVFVTDYPIALKPWYMLPNPSSASSSTATATDPSRQTIACFDLLVPQLGELVGGSLREHRTEKLLAAMAKHGIEESEYEWYVDLRRYGSTRHGGFGMGWERLVAYFTGIENVRDCIAFPRAAEGSRF